MNGAVKQKRKSFGAGGSRSRNGASHFKGFGDNARQREYGTGLLYSRTK